MMTSPFGGRPAGARSLADSRRRPVGPGDVPRNQSEGVCACACIKCRRPAGPTLIGAGAGAHATARFAESSIEPLGRLAPRPRAQVPLRARARPPEPPEPPANQVAETRADQYV